MNTEQQNEVDLEISALLPIEVRFNISTTALHIITEILQRTVFDYHQYF